MYCNQCGRQLAQDGSCPACNTAVQPPVSTNANPNELVPPYASPPPPVPAKKITAKKITILAIQAICLILCVIIAFFAGTQHGYNRAISRQKTGSDAVKEENSVPVVSSARNAGEKEKVDAVSATETEGTSSLPGIGDFVEVDGVRFTLQSVVFSKGNGRYPVPASGFIYVVCTVQAENISGKSQSIYPVSFSAYLDDYQYSEKYEATFEENIARLNGEIAPGKKLLGVVGFELPLEGEILEIHTGNQKYGSSENGVFTINYAEIGFS